MTTTEPHPALAHRCPFCGAAPNQPCRTHRGRGAETGLHSRRIGLAFADPAETPKPPRQALCCDCGNLRTVGRNYYRSNDENRGGGLFNDPRGWFNTGTLKCSRCGGCTRHALLGVDDELDYAEAYQSYVLGGASPFDWEPERESLRERYFAQFPRNPKLSHWYVISEAKAVWEAGDRTVTALCGETMTLHREPGSSEPSTPADQLVDPGRIHWDTEFEDTETGLWWVDMDCVNCLRVSNTRRLERKRTELLAQLVEVAGAVKSMDAADVAELREHLGRLMGPAQ